MPNQLKAIEGTWVIKFVRHLAGRATCQDLISHAPFIGKRDQGEFVDSIEIERDGKAYEAEYFVDQGLVTVYGDRGQESTQLGGLSEQQAARFLLNSLIRKGHIDPVEPGAA